MDLREWQPLNASASISVTVSGISTDSKEIQKKKVRSRILLKDLGRMILFSDVQPQNEQLDISVTESDILIHSILL